MGKYARLVLAAALTTSCVAKFRALRGGRQQTASRRPTLQRHLQCVGKAPAPLPETITGREGVYIVNELHESRRRARRRGSSKRVASSSSKTDATMAA